MDTPPAETRPFAPDLLRQLTEQQLALERARAGWGQAPATGAPPPDRGLYRKVGLPVLLGGIGADVASTYHIMRQGGREANPVYGKDASFGKVAGINAALAAAIALALDRVAKTHPKVATGAALGIGGFRGGVAARNMAQD